MPDNIAENTKVILLNGDAVLNNNNALVMPSGSATCHNLINGTDSSVRSSALNNTLTLTKFMQLTPIVSAGYISSGTTTTVEINLVANMPIKVATTYTPTTSNQTIPSGSYLVGTQTISGDANLIASNIKKDVTIFGVTGTYEGSGGGGGGTTTVTFYPSLMGGGYNLAYVDANGNTVTTDYYSLDTEFNGSATVNATVGTPISIALFDPIDAGITAPSNATLFFSQTGFTGSRPSVYYLFQTYIVN